MKKSCTVKNKLGNEILYNRYKNFRLKLHKIIKAAKKSYNHRKFNNVKGNINMGVD